MLDHSTHFRNKDAFIEQKNQEKRNGCPHVTLVHLHCALIPHAPATEASDVFSHFVVVQEQIDHVEQQTQNKPNR